MTPKDPNDMFPHSENNSQGGTQNTQKNDQPAGPKPVNQRQAGTPSPQSPQKNSKRASFGLLIVGVLFILLFVFVLVLAAVSSSDNEILGSIFNIEGDVRSFITNIVNILFGLLSAIALIALIVGGFIYMVSMGDKKEVKKARLTLIASGIGLFLVAISWAVMIVVLESNAPNENEVIEESVIFTNPDPAQGSAPLTVVFDVQGYPAEGYFFNWEYGDGQTGVGKSNSHIYNRVGLYDAKVQIINAETQEAFLLKTQVLVDNTSPIAKIFADPISGRAPLSVEFDASDSKDPNGNIVKYEWDFGDPAASDNSNSAEGERVTHVFERDGTYTVSLTVEDNNGETQTATQTIEVGMEPDIPIAKITTTPAIVREGDENLVTGTVPFKVSFNASQSRDKDGEIVEYQWDFGDGSAPASSMTANHTYTELGNYNAQLTITDNDDKQDTTSVLVIVKESAKAPTALISSKPPADSKGKITGTAPLTLELNGSESSDEDGNIILYEWNYGDNTTIETGEVVTHTYEQVGTYTLALTVMDNDNQESIPLEYTIVVKEPDKEAPIGTFSTDPEPPTGYVPFTVDFDASASYDNDGTIISYEWDFGDGNAILSGAQVSHEFYNPGIYTITLTVHDNDGLTSMTTRQVAVQLPAPVATIKASRTSGDAPVTITFDASDSTGNITKYEWDFDDGTKETGRKIDHTFDEVGEYTVTLKVSDSGQQVSRDTIEITVE